VVHARLAVEVGLRIGAQKIHGEVHAFQLAAGNGQVARLGGAGAQHHGIEVVEQLLGRDLLADFGVAAELDALFLEHPQAALDDRFLVQLHVGDAVHEQATGAIGTLEDGHRMARLVELGCGTESRRAGAHHGDLLAGAFDRRLGYHPALLPTVVDDLALDVLDGHRRVVDPQHTGAFAGRRTDAAGKFREIVGLVQAGQGFLPEAPVDQIVPFGDQIVDRTASGHAR